MGARKSTAASRLRSAQKYIASAEHRHRQAIKDIARLRPAERRLENVRAERLLLAGNGERAAYSRFDVERALYLYLSDGGSASISTHVSDVRDIGGEWGDDEGPEAAAISEAETGVSVTSMRRTRNVFGERASSPHRGRKNRGPLPRGAGNPTCADGPPRRFAASHADDPGSLSGGRVLEGCGRSRVQGSR